MPPTILAGDLQAAAHGLDRLPDGMEVGTQVEKRGHDHVSGGSGAGVEEEDFHESIRFY